MSRTKRFYNRMRRGMLRWGNWPLYHPWRQDLVLTSMIPSEWRRNERRARRRLWKTELRMLLRMEATGKELTTQRGDRVYDEWDII
jgi:hypothetical protein